MGINIDANACSFSELKKAYMTKYPQITDEKLLENILLEFGTVIGDTYIILCNEYYEDGNCYYNVGTMIDQVFKTEDEGAFNVLLGLCKEVLGYKELYEAYENLGLEFPEDEDEEEY